MLHPSLGSAPTSDYLPLSGSPTGGTLGARLIQFPGASTALDEVRILAVDHAPGSQVLSTGDGILVGSLADVTGIWSAAEDLSAVIKADGGGFEFAAGDTLFVSLGGEASERAGVAIEAYVDGAGEGSGGILVEGVGTDSLQARILPRARRSTAAVATKADTVRLVFLSPHRVSAIRRVVPASATPSVTALSFGAADHSRLDDVRTSLAGKDTLGVVMSGGDTLALSCAATTAPSDLVRDYVLVVHGKSTMSSSVETELANGVATTPVWRFALNQNRPNPFSDGTRIQFTLPEATDVRLEVFDVAGRRVRTLRTGNLPAGPHSVDWDRRDGSGRRVSAGVYRCRIKAGSFTANRSMVVL